MVSYDFDAKGWVLKTLVSKNLVPDSFTDTGSLFKNITLHIQDEDINDTTMLSVGSYSASSNCGSTWEVVTNKTSHTFSSVGSDIRVKIQLPLTTILYRYRISSDEVNVS